MYEEMLQNCCPSRQLHFERLGREVVHRGAKTAEGTAWML
jgi:hypothetical protein